jgi:hypothetical protein
MPLPWERQWSFTPGPPADDEVESYITEAATKRGIPVEDALKVWAGEGKGAWQSNFHKGGVREPSYGPYQLYKGGGLGNAFEKDTGLDPADPSTWKQGVDYALDTAKKEGWRQWYGAPPELRARGGYVDMNSPSMGAQGKPLPWQRKWEVPQGVAREVPASEMPEVPVKDATPYQPTPWGEIGDDAARSYISSMMGDVMPAIMGLPGEAIKGAQWLDRYLGINSEGSDTPVPFDIAGVKEAVGADRFDYTPQTGAGEMAKKAPLAAAGGVSGGIRGATQIAGGVTGGIIGEDVGGPVGEVIGLVAGSRAGAKPMPKGKAPAITAADHGVSEADQVLTPGTAAVKRTSQEAYQEADAMGVTIGGPAFNNFQRSLDSDKTLHVLKLDPQKHPELSKVFTKIKGGTMSAMTARPQGTMGNLTSTMNLEEFGNLRESVIKHLNSKNADTRRLAGHLLHRLDNFFETSVARQFPKAKPTLDKARHNWKQYEKSKVVDRLMENAKDKAGGYTQSGDENAIRTVFRQLSTQINNDKTGRLRKLWTPDEVRMIRKLSRGKYSPRNAARWVGRLLGPNQFTMTANTGGALASGYTGDPTYMAYTLGGMGVGALSKKMAGMSAAQKAELLSQLVRSGGVMNAPNRTQPFLSGYLAAEEQ